MLKVLVALLIILMMAGIFAIDLATASAETPLRLKVASALGYAAGPLVIAVVFMIFRRFRSGTAFLGITFTVTLLTALFTLGDYVSNHRDREQARVMGSALEKDVTRVLEAQVGADGMPRHINQLVDTKSAATGKVGEIDNYVRNHLNRMITLQNDYLAEVKATGLETLLDPARLATDGNLTESRRIVRNSLAVINKYQEKSLEAFDEYGRGFERINISEASKRSLLSGYKRTEAQQRAELLEQWAQEREVAEKFDEIIELMASRHGQWIIQSGQLVFGNTADLARFKELLKTIDQLAKQQDARQKKAQERMLGAFRKMKD